VAPENTLDAYERAIADDADYGETDLRTTKDGVIVLMHDSTVDRMTDGHGKVEDLTFAEIRALKVKGALREGELVPTFEELLKVTKGKLRIYMDIKAVHPSQVLPLLKKFRMEKEVIAYVYSAAQRKEWATEAPHIPVISDLENMTSPDQIERDWSASKFAISDGNALHYKPEFVAKWHQLGVAVVPDIQNPLESPSQWQPFIDMGVDGFQTDHPGALVKYLKERGIR